MYTVTKADAARFMLMKHGLIGKRRYAGKQGALDFIISAGSIQFDPVDVCGRNADLVLNSRVGDYKKNMLSELLYSDRLLYDYWDKCMCIMPVGRWPYLERRRARFTRGEYSSAEVDSAIPAVIDAIRRNGQLSISDFKSGEKLFWIWENVDSSRAALDALFNRGELIVSGKDGIKKLYDLPERHIDKALLAIPDPFTSDEDYTAWHIAQRIGSVGMLPDRRSDAFLAIADLDGSRRHAAFARLSDEGTILEAKVEGVKHPLYFLSSDLPVFERAAGGERPEPRVEFIAPLDNLIWDRALIAAVFDFEYTWEIYMPKAKRKYGYYVLPVLFGEGFAGRIEASADGKQGVLTVKNIWLDTPVPGDLFGEALARLASLNGCADVRYECPKYV